jgi:hypothetical protein
MYFEKGSKKNRKFAFSITQAIMLLAASVAIFTSVVTKDAFAADPITNCFIANAIINPSYYQAEQHFINLLPSDKLFTKLAAEAGLNPPQNNADLYVLWQKEDLNLNTKAMNNEIANLLAAAGFAQVQQNGINTCIGEIGSG